MKKELIIILSLLFTIIIGCDSGGQNEKYADHETAPDIVEVILYSAEGDEELLPSNSVRVGDRTNFEVYATDPDLDMVTLYISQHLLPSELHYGNDIEILLPTQSNKDAVYWLLEDRRATGPVGEWRICFWIVDKLGNESEEFCVHSLIE